jgi:molybdopterin molybdotransferase
MITAGRALEILQTLSTTRKMGVEKVPLAQAMGRVLAEPVVAQEDLPAFDNSAMDGFAVRWQELQTHGGVLPVLRRLIAGDTTPTVNGVGAVEIMTGAPIPVGGFDTIVKVEDTEAIRVEGVPCIRVLSPVLHSVRVGDHIRKRGTDFRAGTLAGRSGKRIDPATLMAFAALGIHEVPVRVRPRVRVLSTGNELQDPGSGSLREGMIWNATGTFLLESLRVFGAEVEYLGIAGDETEGRSRVFEAELARALKDRVDVLITTGAVSMGVHDFIPRAVADSLGSIAFHRISIRPGKPLLVAQFPDRGPTILIGIPGNPISSAVSFEFFVKPYLRDLLSLHSPDPEWAVLSAPVEKPEGLRCFLRGKWLPELDGSRRVEALPGQASFMIHSLLDADVWIELPEEGSVVTEGCRVRVHPIPRSFA